MVTLILALLGIAGFAYSGRVILRRVGIAWTSLLGGSLVAGYALFGLAMLLSVRLFGTATPGALGLTALVLFLAIRQHGAVPATGGISAGGRMARALDGLTALILLSWLAATAVTYLPLMLSAAAPAYELPEVFDLPKHLFAGLALHKPGAWPPPSPFLAGEAFAYNYLFYLPPAFIAGLVDDPLAFHITLPLALLAVAAALPLTMVDLARRLTPAAVVGPAAAMLATWAGGLTPLWVGGPAPSGAGLHRAGLIDGPIWIDELFVSILYVPQHILAVLCGLLAAVIAADAASDPGKAQWRLAVASVLVVCGCLSSLILVPHLLVMFALLWVMLAWRHGLSSAPDRQFRRVLALYGAAALPLLVLLPFLAEAHGWAGGTGLFSRRSPTIFSAQWFYVSAAIGLVVPLAVVGVWASMPRSVRASRLPLPGELARHAVLVAIFVGAVGLLTLSYPDAGLKSGLWLRIALTPLACLGLATLLARVRGRPATVASWALVSSAVIAVVVLNAPTHLYLMRSAWRPLAPTSRQLIDSVRALPGQAAVALVVDRVANGEQRLVAAIGRRIDFDFSRLRRDTYMPEEGRLRAQTFWRGLASGEEGSWRRLDRDYDFVLTGEQSALRGALTSRYGQPITTVGGYAVFQNVRREVLPAAAGAAP